MGLRRRDVDTASMDRVGNWDVFYVARQTAGALWGAS